MTSEPIGPESSEPPPPIEPDARGESAPVEQATEFAREKLPDIYVSKRCNGDNLGRVSCEMFWKGYRMVGLPIQEKLADGLWYRTLWMLHIDVVRPGEPEHHERVMDPVNGRAIEAPVRRVLVPRGFTR